MRMPTKIQKVLVMAAAAAMFAPLPAAGRGAAADEVMFSKDIAPILQRSCQKCHRPDALAPMSLITYEDVRPWARAIKYRTGLRDQPGVMPPWYIEKNVGIQRFKDDLSLSDGDIRTIATWADNGAPQGDPADMPTPPPFIDVDEWQIGERDLIVSSPSFEVQAAVGGLFVVHHALFLMVDAEGEADPRGAWPVHEVGRNADFFDAEAGRLLEAGSALAFPSVHVHSNGTDTTARLDIGFKLHPKGYEPTKEI